MQMVWAADVSQAGFPEIGCKYLQIPRQAQQAKLGTPNFIPSWTLESLTNEILSTTKKNAPGNRRLNCSSWNALVECANALIRLENAEDSLWLPDRSALSHLPRIGHRQFEWQVGFANHARVYRSLFSYSSPECAKHFQSTHGLSISDFTTVGMAVWAELSRGPVVERTSLYRGRLGVSQDSIDAALTLMSISIQDARQMAEVQRSREREVAYQESILRSTPCILFDGRLRAPLRDLVWLRVTDGIYYDIIGANSHARNLIAERFEQYCAELLDAQLSELNVQREFKYQVNGRSQDSPDVLIGISNEILIPVECKGKRMRVSDKFNFSEETPDIVLSEIAKGAFQIWRFASHLRRGIVRDIRLSASPVGLVVTRDDWLTLSLGRHKFLLDKAKELATKDPDILSADHIPIAFCSIENLEQLLKYRSLDAFQETIRAAATEEYSSWSLVGLREKVSPGEMEIQPYPFSDRIANYLPWWPSE